MLNLRRLKISENQMSQNTHKGTKALKAYDKIIWQSIHYPKALAYKLESMQVIWLCHGEQIMQNIPFRDTTRVLQESTRVFKRERSIGEVEKVPSATSCSDTKLEFSGRWFADVPLLACIHLRSTSRPSIIILIN